MEATLSINVKELMNKEIKKEEWTTVSKEMNIAVKYLIKCWYHYLYPHLFIEDLIDPKNVIKDTLKR